MESLGSFIRKKRQELGYTQKELAGRAGFGPRYISHIESDSSSHIPSSAALGVLSAVLHVNCDFLSSLPNGYINEKPTGYRDLKIPSGPLPDLSNFPIFKCESFVASSDWHLPAQDGEFATKIVNLALRWNIDTFSVGGDFGNYSEFSKYVPQRNTHFGNQLKEMRRVLELLTGSFRLVLMKRGNHEERLLGKTLKGQIIAEEFAHMLSPAKNFHFTDYWHTGFELPTGKWLTAHPENVSVYPAKLARDLESTKFPGFNVITEHEHAIGYGRTRDNRYWAVSSGMVADPKKLDYYQMKPSTTSAMCQGCVIVKSGQPFLLTPETNFNMLMGMT